MSQTRLFIITTKARAQDAAHRLEAEFDDDGLPVASFEVTPDDTATGEREDAPWSISIYAPADSLASVETRMIATLEAAGIHAVPDHEMLGDKDWVSATLADLAPVRAGRFVVHGRHDRGCARPGEIGVEIDAGQAFGTGHHGTTAGCLAMLDRHMRARRIRRMLDVGTGSGVLAIALAKAARIPVLASDIDPVAVDVARRNARLNRVHQLVNCVTATGMRHRMITRRAPYDLVVANILAGPLQRLGRDLSRMLDRRATIILSGLLPHQRARIVATYRACGMRLVRAHIRDGWLTLVLRKGR